MRRFFEALLRLYPAEYKARFSGEIRAVLHESAEATRREGTLAQVMFYARETLGLLAGIAVEWIAKAPSSSYMRNQTPDEIAKSRQRIQLLTRQIEHAIAHHDFEGARFYSKEDSKERARLQHLQSNE